MSFNDFEQSLVRDARPPAGLAAPLRALWLDAKGDWAGAHALAQTADGTGPDKTQVRAGAWVHAYLHRKEGDEDNAAYWYARAGRPAGTGELAAEWREIVSGLLQQGGTAPR